MSDSQELQVQKGKTYNTYLTAQHFCRVCGDILI